MSAASEKHVMVTQLFSHGSSTHGPAFRKCGVCALTCAAFLLFILVVSLRRQHQPVEHSVVESTEVLKRSVSAVPRERDPLRVERFIKDAQCKLNFFLAWTTAESKFNLRYRRTVESALRLHPTACVIVYSPTLARNYFQRLWEMGYNIIVERPNVPYLLKGTPAEAWYKGIRRWRQGPYFFSHITEILRLATLHKYGGVYLDTDVIVMRQLDGLHNALGTELANERGEPKVLNGAVLVFDKGSQFIYESMVEFNSTYRIDSWGWNGPELVTRVANRFPRGEQLHVLPTLAFYPIHWAEVVKYFDEENMEQQHAMWEEMVQETYLFHYWNKITVKLIPKPASLMYKVLNNYCIFCNETGPDG